MNDTMANLTANLTNPTLVGGANNTTLGNETVREAVTSAGNFGLDKLFNMSWADGIAAWLNATFSTGMFSGSVIAALVPIITILFIYWKWNAIMQALQTVGQTVLFLLILFVAAKAFGIL